MARRLNLLDILARAAAPLGLFCLGTSLPAISWEVISEALAGTLLKLVVMPLAVGMLCYWAGFGGLALYLGVSAEEDCLEACIFIALGAILHCLLRFLLATVNLSTRGDGPGKRISADSLTKQRKSFDVEIHVRID